MFLKKKILRKTLFLLALAGIASVNAQEQPHRLELQLGWMDLKPISNNYTYAFDVAGTQPYFQSWHAQALNPSYSSAYEVGAQYSINESALNISMDWTHLHSSDSSSKQGNQTLQVTNIEFIAPPFEMSPPVFGIRHANATLQNKYDNVTVNLEKVFAPTFWHAKIIGGVNVLHLKQTISTTFSDLVGAEPTPYSYTLAPDPSYAFQIQSISNFMGIGPDLGLSSELEIMHGLSIVGSALGSLNVGTISVQENFTATSANLTQNGTGVSKQQITAPNKTQVVPGMDGKLGLIYRIQNKTIANFSVEAGYRVMTYMNAISTIAPQTLVQTGTNPGVPEFSTGTMAIVSITQQDRPFNLNGPYVMLKLNIL